MNKSKLLFSTVPIAVILTLATSGCATKKYVQTQIAPVNSKVGALEAKTSEQAEKEQTDVSRVEEKIGSTDAKVAEVAATAQQATASAAQANQLGQQNQSAIAANQAAIAADTASISTLDKAMTYSLVAKGDVTFDFDKSKLGKTDQAALDALIQQAQSMPRPVFELIGFTDPVGAVDYNLALSRRRADAVARYLVQHGVGLQGIRTIGLGKEPVPQGLLADVQAVDANFTAADARRLARRVVVRIYAANASVESASLK
jgi:OOP family OmpA-OmpF porin